MVSSFFRFRLIVYTFFIAFITASQSGALKPENEIMPFASFDMFSTMNGQVVFYKMKVFDPISKTYLNDESQYNLFHIHQHRRYYLLRKIANRIMLEGVNQKDISSFKTAIGLADHHSLKIEISQNEIDPVSYFLNGQYLSSKIIYSEINP
ncbi:MAG: hypothetical protein K2P98_02010 [Neisseriaceae bacterium]|nr:hypothetical protein [Neisseriaceae bacterium]